MNELAELKKPLIYLITKGNLTRENFSEESKKTLRIIKNAVEKGISLIQIREKNLFARSVLELTEQAVRIAEKSGTKILVNERADVAAAANADGVHLTSNALPVSLIRQNFGKGFIIGVSAHSLERALQAKNETADFVTFSPVFPTISKPLYGEPKGLKELNEVCKKLGNFPVIALGGIDETNYKDVLEQGAGGFAGIGFLNDKIKLKNQKFEF